MERLSAARQAKVNNFFNAVYKRIVSESLKEVMDAWDESADHTFEELVEAVTLKCVAKGSHFTESMVAPILQEIIEAL
jgi:hypothetical protein